MMENSPEGRRGSEGAVDDSDLGTPVQCTPSPSPLRPFLIGHSTQSGLGMFHIESCFKNDHSSMTIEEPVSNPSNGQSNSKNKFGWYSCEARSGEFRPACGPSTERIILQGAI